MDDIRRELKGWLGNKACRRKEQESLVDHLCHTSKRVKPERRSCAVYLMHCWSSTSPPPHLLGSEVCSDILWWYSFMADWNGVSIIPQLRSPLSVVYFNASGSFGCGALFLSLGKWLQLPWKGRKETSKDKMDSITWMERLPIVLAYAAWVPRGTGKE